MKKCPFTGQEFANSYECVGCAMSVQVAIDDDHPDADDLRECALVSIAHSLNQLVNDANTNAHDLRALLTRKMA